RARQRGLHLAVRGPVALTGLLQEGDIFGGLLNLVRDSGSAPVAAVLAGWAGPESERASRVASDLVGRGVFLTTELLAAYRSVFVRESLDVPFLELNEPILPHVRWLLQMRRAGGYAAGRAALREYAGLAEPTKSEAAAARRGWSRLVSLAVDLLSSSTTLKLASSSPKLAMLPGFGLKEELVLLHASGVSLNRLLQQATGFPTGNEAQGRVLITQVPPESGERFLRSLRPAASGAS
ncbi:MAG: hypothetical protein Q4B08_14925, partial [Propionibacteriaceae bacterium]|nr:hypothetical protein [Propionibacteriaceae bacterium]